MNSKGQVLVFSLVLMPLLLLMAGVLVRAGMTALVYSRVQRFLDRRALEALTLEAQGLEALGKLNGRAAVIIDSRRKVDLSIAEAMGTPAALPLITLRNVLLKSQALVAAEQTKIKSETAQKTFQKLNERPPRFYQGKTFLFYSPQIPLGPHGLKESLILHVKPQSAYAGEVGAPLETDNDFIQNQIIRVSARVKIESFLPPWLGFKKIPPLKIYSGAEIKMKDLEAPWTVKIDKAEGNLSWN